MTQGPLGPQAHPLVNVPERHDGKYPKVYKNVRPSAFLTSFEATYVERFVIFFHDCDIYDTSKKK